MSAILSYLPGWESQSTAVVAAEERAVAKSTFDAAMPYAAASMAAQVIGTAAVAVAVEGSPLFLLGAAVALLGYHMFLGILATGLWYAGNPAGFRRNIGKILTVISLVACGNILWDVGFAKEIVVSDLFFSRLFSAI